jgi:aryl-alcohol dehydrogenase-like predicted oxidoreductase
MEYRFLGNSGLKVSVISLGNWLNNNKDSEAAQDLMTKAVKTAFELGINFFDTAEGYGFGIGQRQLGVALKELNIPRE